MNHPTTPTGPIKILLVDDHEVVGQGLRTLLEDHDDLTVVARLTPTELRKAAAYFAEHHDQRVSS